MLCALVGIPMTSCTTTDPPTSANSPNSTEPRPAIDGSDVTVAAPTEVRHVGPFDPDVLPADTLPDRATCSQEARVVVGALRCSAGHFIFDPCWIDTSGEAAVACMPDPWSDPWRMELAEPVAVEPLEGDDRTPWAVELQSGLVCTFTGGMGEYIGDEYATYCDPATRYLLLPGTIDRTSSTWTIEVAVPTHDARRFRQIGRQDIATAWFGR